MRARVTMEAILLPDSHVATETGALIPAARWRSLGCTGTEPSDLCFVTARIGPERWYAKVGPDVLDERGQGASVTLERYPDHPLAGRRSPAAGDASDS